MVILITCGVCRKTVELPSTKPLRNEVSNVPMFSTAFSLPRNSPVGVIFNIVPFDQLLHDIERRSWAVGKLQDCALEHVHLKRQVSEGQQLHEVMRR